MMLEEYRRSHAGACFVVVFSSMVLGPESCFRNFRTAVANDGVHMS